MTLQTDILAKAATQARGLAIDAVHACSSGHLGLPLGCADMGAVLFGKALNYLPNDPDWINRDRFILSAGHGSMFLYSWLHLSGYDLPLEELKNFRQLHSRTPGHPEAHETVGVECTTGPLGQGVGNAVGIAMAAKMAEARFNTESHTIFDHKVVCIAGDGCLQEGVAMEAASFAGHYGLDNLILIFDCNLVTLDAMAEASQSDDFRMRFEAIHWDVLEVDGHNMEEFLAAYEKARSNSSGKPQIIIAKTTIGKGIPEVAGTQKAHGEGGAKFADEARKGLGLPADQHFYVSDEVRGYFAEHRKTLQTAYDQWQTTYADWKSANPDLAALLESGIKKEVPSDLFDKIPEFEADAKLATRKAGSAVLQPIAEAMPLLIGGSADLYGSTNNYINASVDFNKEHREGRNIRFGIREHGMCAMLNGIAYHGVFRPSGATFLVFADYCRASIRLAALTGLPVTYIFTHDSIGVGEDGPTHQPVETVAGLRVIQHLDVIRPADPEETAGAFVAAMERTDGPTLLALTRQNLPLLSEISVSDRRQGVLKGGYIAKKESGDLKMILMATGSELQHAMEAAKKLGDGIRVVSLPSFERFKRQSAEYQESVLPNACRKRVAIEAGVPDIWWQFVGLEGKVVGLEQFGLSAPGATVMKELGITAEHLVEVAKTLL